MWDHRRKELELGEEEEVDVASVEAVELVEDRVRQVGS